MQILVTARSKAWSCGRSLAGIAVSNPAGGMDSLSLVSVVLSDRGLCDMLITRPLVLSSYEKKELPESLTSEMGGLEEKNYHFFLGFLIFSPCVSSFIFLPTLGLSYYYYYYYYYYY
jgi:hypothetical protein